MKHLLLVALVAAAPSTAQPPALKDAYRDSFRIGAALNRAQIYEEDARGLPLIRQHFNTISPENVLKWALLNPTPGGYNFEAADRYVAFGEKHGMFIVGHTLVWHSQTPRWVFEDGNGNPASRELLLARMRDHIRTVVGRYRGRIHGWDVVNEALSEEGGMRPSPWMKIIGEDYLLKAFQFAHEADPKAELYYNDYSVERPDKRRGALALVRKLKQQGAAITGVGLQGHNSLDFPSLDDQETTIAEFRNLGVKVMITELDVDVLPRATRTDTADVAESARATAAANPYTAGLPEEVQKKLTARYAELFRIYRKYQGTVTRVTFWGVTDGDSWKNNFPVRGRTNYPLLFDREGKPKPAFDAVIAASRD